jgi:MoxR-like ATPase
MALETAPESMEVQHTLERVRTEIGKVFVGQSELVDQMILALMCGGHVLLEGVPGLGKTLLVRTIGQVLELSFSRVQFTPDLMPADIIGTNVLLTTGAGERQFQFQKGPVFTHLLLADEINRATPKTQSALLEAMQELRVTVGGKTYPLPQPFFVLATQNPIEMEGTYPLPEAQIDRFMFKLHVSSPNMDDLRTIINRTTGDAAPEARPVLSANKIIEFQALVREVPITGHVQDAALVMVLATHPDAPQATPLVQRYVRYGASPRGAQSIVLAAKARALMDGRFNVSMEDIQQVAPAALRHRVLLNFAAEADEIQVESVIAEVIATAIAE